MKTRTARPSYGISEKCRASMRLSALAASMLSIALRAAPKLCSLLVAELRASMVMLRTLATAALMGMVPPPSLLATRLRCQSSIHSASSRWLSFLPAICWSAL
ncbi:hypothetical protein D3C76_1351370 [compost metagenome]